MTIILYLVPPSTALDNVVMGHQIKLRIYIQMNLVFTKYLPTFLSWKFYHCKKGFFFAVEKIKTNTYYVIFVKNIGGNMIRRFKIWSDELVIDIYVQIRNYLIFFSSKCKDSDSENPDVICNGRGKFWQYRLPSFQSGNIFLAKTLTFYVNFQHQKCILFDKSV